MKYQFDSKEHAHFLDGSPLYGTSTVIKEVMPPFLAKWGAQCAVDFIRENLVEPIDSYSAIEGGGMVEPATLEKAVMAWSKVRKEAASKGTDLHASLELYVNECIAHNDGQPRLHVDISPIYQFTKWAVESIDEFVLAEKYTYSKDLWVGGIVDCVAKMRDGSLVVIDFKSSKDAYFNQFAQAAGYSLQLMESGYGGQDGSNWQQLEGPITKLIVVPFGAKTLKPSVIENVQGYQDVFKSLVNVYSYLRSFKAN